MTAALITSLGAALVAIVTAILTYRANSHKTEVERDQSAGLLALEYSEKTDKRMEALIARFDKQTAVLEATQEELRNTRLQLYAEQDERHEIVRQLKHWWPTHDAYDDAVAQALERLDPGAIDRLPNRPPMPIKEA